MHFINKKNIFFNYVYVNSRKIHTVMLTEKPKDHTVSDQCTNSIAGLF